MLADGTPLAETTEWAAHPHAWPKLWKHHAAQDQADRINALAHARGEKWISRHGGRISAEWQYAKALQVLEEDPAVYAACARWMEAADCIVWQLTGVESRNACTAGYRGIFQDGCHPGEEYLAALHPGFADFARTRLEHPLAPLGSRVGSLTAQAAEWRGLPGIPVAAGNVDAHVAAPAAPAVENGMRSAATAMGRVLRGAYQPDARRADAYDALYAEYPRPVRPLRHRSGQSATPAAPHPQRRPDHAHHPDHGPDRPERGTVNAAINLLCRQVSGLHRELAHHGPVVRTAGHASARVPGEDLLVIKPTGVSYGELPPQNDWSRGCDLAPSEPMTPARAAGVAPLPAALNGVVACRETYSYPMVK